MSASTLGPRTRIRNRGISLVALLIIILIIAAAVYYYRTHTAEPSRTPGSSGSSAQGEAPETDFKPLAGKWVRPDTGVVLEILSVDREGPVSVMTSGTPGTFVSAASVHVVDGLPEMSVEFSDASCSGCTMRINYDGSGDRLVGSYRESSGARRDVVFMRTQ